MPEDLRLLMKWDTEPPESAPEWWEQQCLHDVVREHYKPYFIRVQPWQKKKQRPTVLEVGDNRDQVLAVSD